MSPTIDEWVEIEDFPEYSVNRLGQVRNDSTGRILRIRTNQFGVPYVGMMRDGRQYIRSLPRLVASTFIHNPQSYYVRQAPINLNGDRTDCRVDNLMWRPWRYAELYNNQFNDRYSNPLEEAIRETETGEEFPDSLAAARRFGLLEREIVLSIINNTVVWPTGQRFEICE